MSQAHGGGSLCSRSLLHSEACTGPKASGDTGYQALQKDNSHQWLLLHLGSWLWGGPVRIPFCIRAVVVRPDSSPKWR